jgi:F0F1-type ATP synthase delta subunit
MPAILTKEIIEQKKELREILSKYGVKEPEEIERKIENGELPEHPTYEDFLSALALKNNIEKMKRLFGELIEEI